MAKTTSEATSKPKDKNEAKPLGFLKHYFIPHRSHHGQGYTQHPHSLAEFREREGRDNRKRKLHALWQSLPPAPNKHLAAPDAKPTSSLTQETAESLQARYDDELVGRCGGRDSVSRGIRWKEFKEYAEAKETELWTIFHDELDLDGNGQLDALELALALEKAGISLPPTTLSEFMTTLTSSPQSSTVSFSDFRDFLLLLPRKASPAEIYRYYEVQRFLGDDGHGAARVTMEGDVSLSAEDKPPDAVLAMAKPSSHPSAPPLPYHHQEEELEGVDFIDEEESAKHAAFKFLLAGGVAGAVSRTFTAPFDRVKIFLMTRPGDLVGIAPGSTASGPRVLVNAVSRIYAEGSILGFWTGNGLSVAKIFPESAIKFFAYEYSKRAFAKYWDDVEDPRDISGVSRFMSGGIGGISSQLSIYPIETLKTQMMSSTGTANRTLVAAVRHVWALGGIRAYYRGLTIGLVGVFPYSAIDMSTFEALKLTYLRSTGKEEPGVLALLAFGSISGSVGATSVYPLNLVRTRLQASGSSGHPQRYTGVWDVTLKTWERDGWRGFYRGLFPTLAKVVPSVSISYVVYEYSKRRLGV
ncbi:mitochondrial carrier [Pluteus cervinus]|uniref:Mitochondrial carrier n=1 Tax=Pluteus cervinus TaxID=181527 RepID=A0ACD3BDP6_9AGAR|nr:mitochondrial carrier [Pluteus cervinus]